MRPLRYDILGTGGLHPPEVPDVRPPSQRQHDGLTHHSAVIHASGSSPTNASCPPICSMSMSQYRMAAAIKFRATKGEGRMGWKVTPNSRDRVRRAPAIGKLTPAMWAMHTLALQSTGLMLTALARLASRMVDPLSVALGVGVAAVILLAAAGLYLYGYVRSRGPDHIVDMREVSNYYRHKNSNEALNEDVED